MTLSATIYHHHVARLREIIMANSFRTGDFTLASGKKSNFYLDLKPTMLNPEGAHRLGHVFNHLLLPHHVDVVGGLEMGAVPLVAAVTVASFMWGNPTPGFFVRKTQKDHGTQRLIEGIPSVRDRRVAVLEDVATTGASVLKAVEAVQAEWGIVAVVIAIVDRADGAEALLGSKGIRFESLFKVDEFHRIAGVAPTQDS